MSDKRSGKVRRADDVALAVLQENLDNHIQDSHHELKLIRESQAECKNDIMKEIAKYHDDIKPLLERERDYEGAVRVGKRFQNFVQYWVKWPIILAGVLAIGRFIVDHWHKLMNGN